MKRHVRVKGQTLHRLADSACLLMAEGEGQRSKVDHTDIKAYVVKDGSLVKELMHPNVYGNSDLSVTETIIPVGKTTLLHKL